MAKSDNVLHGFDDSLVVIHIDVCDQGLRLSHIQNDDRQSAMGKLIEKVGSNFSEVMMATPPLPLNHAADTNLHAVGVVVGVGDDHFITMMDGARTQSSVTSSGKNGFTISEMISPNLCAGLG